MSQVDWSAVNILVAEDEEDLREILVHVFEGEGSHVHSAKDGCEAFDIVKNNQIDLVISDIRMPKCDGIQLLEKIRNANPDSPLVFLATGFSDINEEEAKKRGAVDLIHKPFTIKNLFSLIEASLLKNKRFVRAF